MTAEKNSQLGSMVKLPESPDEAVIDKIANPHPGSVYLVRFTAPEFTTLCPVTGQPDFAHIVMDYVPDGHLVESKSLKLYLFAYRNHNTFHEESVNKILDDIITACAPRECVVEGDFNARGGIGIKVSASGPD